MGCGPGRDYLQGFSFPDPLLSGEMRIWRVDALSYTLVQMQLREVGGRVSPNQIVAMAKAPRPPGKPLGRQTDIH